MRRSLVPTTIAALAALPGVGCGASEAEVRAAKTSGYKTDFAIVYSETLEAVREIYPTLADDPRTGAIKTAWHAITVRQGTDEQRNTGNATTTGVGTGPNQLVNPNVEQQRFFIRFDINVVGGKPWRVRVHGQAAEYHAGDALPVPLKGAAKPPWLEGRTNTLEVAIYKRLKKYAVQLKYREEVAERPKPPPPIDVAKFGSVPKGAASVIGQVEQAAEARDPARLRALMADEFTYSLGDSPSADTAILVWQADPTTIDELRKAVGGACAQDPQKLEVVCPAAYLTDPGFTGYRAGFRPVGGSWKMVFFVAGE